MRGFVVGQIIIQALLWLGTISPAAEDASGTWRLTLRSGAQSASGDGQYQAVDTVQSWQPRQTAVIVCDMWDAHHCLHATRRVGEMAPRMNEVLRAARDRGALIVHAPSSCMASYEDHPARQRARQAPPAATLPADIGQWCEWKDAREQDQGYPIDHSDGGEDDDPHAHSQWSAQLRRMGRDPQAPWVRQIDVLEIDPQRDAISDSGAEIWNLLESRDIHNVILLGVHTNMCVLGRPFGLRQMAKNGKNVVLMRDMTDTMYNPARSPYVSHFRGTDLVDQACREPGLPDDHQRPTARRRTVPLRGGPPPAGCRGDCRTGIRDPPDTAAICAAVLAATARLRPAGAGGRS